MSEYKLIISIPILMDEDWEEECKPEFSKQLLKLFGECSEYVYKNAKASLVRTEDRSGGNLLLPKLEGKFGNHYVNKKVAIKDIK